MLKLFLHSPTQSTSATAKAQTKIKLITVAKMILSSYLLFTCMCIIESLFYCHFDRIFSILKGTFMTLMFITSIVCLGKRKTNRIIFQEQKGSFINFEFLNLIGLEKKLHFPPIIFIFYYTNLFLYIVNESQLPQTKMEAHKDLVSHPVL